MAMATGKADHETQDRGQGREPHRLEDDAQVQRPDRVRVVGEGAIDADLGQALVVTETVAQMIASGIRKKANSHTTGGIEREAKPPSPSSNSHP